MADNTEKVNRAMIAFVNNMRREWVRLHPGAPLELCPVMNVDQYPIPQITAMHRSMSVALQAGQ